MNPPKVKKTGGDEVRTALKTLFYADAGWGKTTQAVFMEKRYGKALILSGEAGLMSIANHDMDYIPFSTWKEEPKEGTYSLYELQKYVSSPEFLETDYKVIVLDSLTEAASLITSEVRRTHNNVPNPVMWGDIKSGIIGLVKAIRDLPVHVLVTSLRISNTDENTGATHYEPACGGAGTRVEVMGVFDFVFGGTKMPVPYKDNATGKSVTMSVRHIIADEFNGWKCKAREPLTLGKRRRIRASTRTGDITELFSDLEMSNEDWEKKLAVQAKQQEQNQQQQGATK